MCWCVCCVVLLRDVCCGCSGGNVMCVVYLCVCVDVVALFRLVVCCFLSCFVVVVLLCVSVVFVCVCVVQFV